MTKTYLGSNAPSIPLAGMDHPGWTVQLLAWTLQMLLSEVALGREHIKSKAVNKRYVIHQKQAPDAAFLASAAKGSKQLDVRAAVWTLSLFPWCWGCSEPVPRCDTAPNHIHMSGHPRREMMAVTTLKEGIFPFEISLLTLIKAPSGLSCFKGKGERDHLHTS